MHALLDTFLSAARPVLQFVIEIQKPVWQGVRGSDRYRGRLSLLWVYSVIEKALQRSRMASARSDILLSIRPAACLVRVGCLKLAVHSGYSLGGDRLDRLG